MSPAQLEVGLAAAYEAERFEATRTLLGRF